MRGEIKGESIKTFSVKSSQQVSTTNVLTEHYEMCVINLCFHSYFCIIEIKKGAAVVVI